MCHWTRDDLLVSNEILNLAVQYDKAMIVDFIYKQHCTIQNRHLDCSAMCKYKVDWKTKGVHTTAAQFGRLDILVKQLSLPRPDCVSTISDYKDIITESCKVGHVNILECVIDHVVYRFTRNVFTFEFINERLKELAQRGKVDGIKLLININQPTAANTKYYETIYKHNITRNIYIDILALDGIKLAANND
jgi:hypothetical protein